MAGEEVPCLTNWSSGKVSLSSFVVFANWQKRISLNGVDQKEAEQIWLSFSGS